MRPLLPALFLLGCVSAAPPRPTTPPDIVAQARAALADALADPAPEVRAAAVRAAAADPGLREPAARLLGDADEQVRAEAAAALIGFRSDARPVLAAGLTSARPAVRALAVQALPPGAIAPSELAALARGDGAGPVRAAALRALARAGARDPAVQSGLADAYLGARLAAVDALYDVDGIEARPTLRVLAGGKDTFVALRAAVSLHRLGERETRPLDAALASRDPSARAAALNVVADLVPREEVAARVAAAARDEDPSVRLAAARAFLRTGDEERARPLLVSGLNLADDGLRLTAAADLARMGDRRGWQTLEQLARSNDELTRAGAISAFPRVGEPTLAALRDSSPRVRISAAAAILHKPVMSSRDRRR